MLIDFQNFFTAISFPSSSTTNSCWKEHCCHYTGSPMPVPYAIAGQIGLQLQYSFRRFRYGYW